MDTKYMEFVKEWEHVECILCDFITDTGHQNTKKNLYSILQKDGYIHYFLRGFIMEGYTFYKNSLYRIDINYDVSEMVLRSINQEPRYSVCFPLFVEKERNYNYIGRWE